MTALAMSDLERGQWTADDETAYDGYAHRAARWNGFRHCYFADDVMAQIVADHGYGHSGPEIAWWLDYATDGERVIEVNATEDGEIVTVARPVMVDGVRLWDTSDSGWTWGAMVYERAHGRPTMTAGQLITFLSSFDADTPVIVRTPDDDDFMNLSEIEDPRPNDDAAIVLATADDFDPRQW